MRTTSSLHNRRGMRVDNSNGDDDAVVRNRAFSLGVGHGFNIGR